MKFLSFFVAFFVAFFLCLTATTGAELRIANLTLSPEQKPNIEVVFEAPCDGVVRLAGPEGWRIVPETMIATPDQKRLVFTVALGRPNEKNSYPFVVEVQQPDGSILQQNQEIHVTTAPNSNLGVAGPDDQGAVIGNWDHAIPCSVLAGDNQIHIRTVWNRRQLCLLLGVDNLRLVPAENDLPFTAVQIALGSVRSDKTAGELYQFLLFAGETGAGRLVSLPDNHKDSPRHLPNVDVSKAFVWKQEDTVWFETAIPFAAIPAIRPGEGRELTLSFLIHDAAQKNVLDWGRTCLLPVEGVEKWFRWKGDSIGDTPLTVPRSEWGLCSSKF